MNYELERMLKETVMVYFKVLWHVDPLQVTTTKEAAIQQQLLSNSSQTSVFPQQQLDTATEKRCFLYDPCRDVISRIVGESQFPAWRRARIPPPYPCESYEATKLERSAWVYNWATLCLGKVVPVLN
jgi:hypothetical protein